MPILKEPPLDPITGFLTGHGLTLRKSRLDYMHHCMDVFGDFVQFRIGKKIRTLMINNPEGVEWVMVKNAKNYNKNTPGYRKVANITGNGVFTDNDTRWKNARRMIQPFFSAPRMPEYSEVVAEISHNFIDQLLQNVKGCKLKTNISPYMTELTLRVLGKCIFNEDLGKHSKEVDQHLTTLINISNDSINDLFPIPTPRKRRNQKRFKQAQTELDKIIKDLMDIARNQDGDEKRNLVKLLDSAEPKLSEQDILDQVKTLAFAGHETSASVLSWTFYFLTKNPDWCKEVTKQVREVLKSDKIELVHLEQMPLLKMFIQETMRLRPPAWSFGRYALAEDEIFGEKVYPGDIITISPFLLHHNKDIYPNPKEFNPNRFLPEEVEKRPKATFIPFGLGPRFCVGADLAMIEISMIVACVLRTFDVEASNSTVEMEPLISLRPKGGVELTLTLKEQS